jgi:hypothetical protein
LCYQWGKDSDNYPEQNQKNADHSHPAFARAQKILWRAKLLHHNPQRAFELLIESSFFISP